MEGLNDDDFVLTTAPAIILAVVFEWMEVAVVGTVALAIWRIYFKPPFDTKIYRLPPRAPFGFLETVKNITTRDIIAFFPRVHRSVKGGKVARLNFFVPGCSYAFLLVDTELSREILQDKTTIKAEGIAKTFDRITDGVSIGPRYYHARKAMAPAFADNQVRRMNQTVAKKTDEWIETFLEPRAAKGEDIDIAHAMIDLTFEIIMEAAFEYKMPTHEKETLLDCLDTTLKEFIFSNPLKQIFGAFVPSVRDAHRKAKLLMDIVDNIIRAYRKNPNPTPGTVIDLIMKNPNYNNDRERAADMVSLIVAGHDTRYVRKRSWYVWRQSWRTNKVFFSSIHSQCQLDCLSLAGAGRESCRAIQASKRIDGVERGRKS